jgi:hypothetical protein
MGISLLRKKVFLGYLGQVRHASQERVQNLLIQKSKSFFHKKIILDPKKQQKKIQKVLVANRGEIAIRIFRKGAILLVFFHEFIGQKFIDSFFKLDFQIMDKI